MQQTHNVDEKEILDGKPYAILSYLWILCFIPLILKKENKFALFHAKQGLVLFLAELTIGFIAILPFIGWILLFAGTLLFGALSLAGIFQSLLGNFWKLPILGDYAEKIKF